MDLSTQTHIEEQYIFEVSKLLTIRQTHLRTRPHHKSSERVISWALRKKGQTREVNSMPSTGLVPALPAIEPLKNCTLDRKTAGIGWRWHSVVKSDEKQMFPRAVSFASPSCCPVFPSSLVIICTRIFVLIIAKAHNVR